MTASRTLAASLETKIAADVPAPGYLVELNLPGGTIRLSSRADVSWAGQLWLAWEIAISGLGSTGNGDLSGELQLGNEDNTFSALVLGAGVSGSSVRVLVVYSDDPGDDDVVEVFAGIANDAAIARDKVVLQLLGDSLATLSLPVGSISPAEGFNHLTPANTVLVWENERIILEEENG